MTNTWSVVSLLIVTLVACHPEGSASRAEANRSQAAGTGTATGRMVAFTFDDLPMSHDGSYGLTRMQEVTTELLAQLQRANITAVGFVNERKLGSGDELPPRRALLEQWLDAGMELGNHTYSHVNFWNTTLDEYERNVLLGERVTRRLLSDRGQRPRYFRHPYLNTGQSLQAKTAFERFLADHGYDVAPVTIDHLDVLYALAYDQAYTANDTALMRRLASAYVDHMRDSFDFFEQLSRRLLGREAAQVLLLHANALNARNLDELVAMLRSRGYTFIPLAAALQDSVYRLPDTYIGPRGVSWLQRWAVTQGKDPGTEPRAPAWVERIAYPTRR